jgi:hypothetical protein
MDLQAIDDLSCQGFELGCGQRERVSRIERDDVTVSIDAIDRRARITLHGVLRAFR